MARIAMGVDVGKGSQQAAAYDPVADRIVGQLAFSSDRAGFERFLSFLEHLAPHPDQVRVGGEATGHYHLTLVEFLERQGYTVAAVNADRAALFRRSQGHTAKTDRIDARALARFVAVTTPSAPPPQAAAWAGLRELTRLRADLARDRTMALNRLRAAVDLAFPELLTVFRQLARATVLAVLQVYPTARAGAAASSAADGSIAARRTEPALAVVVRSLARQVSGLDGEIAEVDGVIAAGLAELGYAPGHFPVGGPVALATVLAEAGDVRRFPSAKHFVAHFGWSPTDSQSGGHKDAHPPLSRAGNRYVRRILWMLAIMAVRHPGPYRTYFERRTQAGKTKMDTLVAIGRKLLTTLYAILRSGRPYDRAYQHLGQTTQSQAA